jgi:predicted Rossmann-fold nucleotide-binding protein
MTRFPIVLVGADYWSGLVSWLTSAPLRHGAVSAADLRLLRVVDDPCEVLPFVRSVVEGELG